MWVSDTHGLIDCTLAWSNGVVLGVVCLEPALEFDLEPALCALQSDCLPKSFLLTELLALPFSFLQLTLKTGEKQQCVETQLSDRLE